MKKRIIQIIAKRELARAGYELLAEHDFLPYQYFLVLRAR